MTAPHRACSPPPRPGAAAAPLHAASPQQQPHHPLAQYRDDATGAISMASPLYGGRQLASPSAGAAGTAAPQRFAAMAPEDTVVVANVLHSGSADGPGLGAARAASMSQRRPQLRSSAEAHGAGLDRGPDASPQQRAAEVVSSGIEVELSRGGTTASAGGGTPHGYYSHLVITADAADAMTSGGDASLPEGFDHVQAQPPQAQLPKDNGPVGTAGGGSLRSAGASAPPVAGPWIPHVINPGGAPQPAMHAWGAADGAAAAMSAAAVDFRGAASRQQQAQQFLPPWLPYGAAGFGWGGDMFGDHAAMAWRLQPVADAAGVAPLVPGEGVPLPAFRDVVGDARKGAEVLQPQFAGAEPDGRPFVASSRQQQLQFEAWQLARSGFVIPMAPPWAAVGLMPSPPGWSSHFGGDLAPHPLGGAAAGPMAGMFMDPYAMLAVQQQQQQQLAQSQQLGGAESARSTAARGHQQFQQQQQQLQQFQQQQQQLMAAAAYNQAIMAQQQQHALGLQLGQTPMPTMAPAPPDVGSARGIGGAVTYDVVSATAGGGSFERFSGSPTSEQRLTQVPALPSPSNTRRDKQPSRSVLSVPCGAFQDDPRAAEHDSPHACLPGSIVPLSAGIVDPDPNFLLATAGSLRVASDAALSSLQAAGSARSPQSRGHEVVSARASRSSEHSSPGPSRSALAE